MTLDEAEILTRPKTVEERENVINELLPPPKNLTPMTF